MRLFSFVKKNRFQKAIMTFLVILLITLSFEQGGMLKVNAATEGDFEHNGNGFIIGYNGSGGDVIIPEMLGGVKVTGISSDAFKGKNLTSVKIPKGVTHLTNDVFRNNGLISVEIPDSVTFIGNGAFRDNKLTSVDIPYGVETITNDAFRNNELTSVEIPDSVTFIGNSVFKDNKLTSVDIPNSVESITSEAFQNNKLTSVEIPKSVTFLPKNAFQGNPDLIIIGEKGSKAKEYADYHNIRFLEIDDPLAIEIDPKGGEDKWVQDASINVNVYGFGKLELQFMWTNSVIHPDINHNGWESFENGNEIVANKDGKQYLHIYAKDEKRRATYGSSEAFQIDSIAPESPSIDVTPDDWTNSEKVTATITDGKEEENGSGVSHTEYRIGEDKDWKTYDGPFDIRDEGETIIQARTIDNVGNESASSEAVVQIDQTAPKLTLRGDNPINLLYGESFTDPDYDVFDNLDGNIQNKVVIEGKVDTTKVGTYELIYSVEDHAGNQTTVTRTVHVNDKEQPVITLNGDNPLILEVGTTYEEPNATAMDNVDGNISDKITITGEVDANKPGTYYVYYNVSDSSGNEAFEAVREVRVVAPDVVWLESGQSSVPVYAGTLVELKGTNTTIQLPNDLPEGTMLHVESVNNIDTSELVQAGEMYNFVFTYSKGYEDYTGDFILTMGVDEHAENVFIYHYNEQNKEWEHIGGDIRDGQITATVNHFSIYGVFAEETDNTEQPSVDNGEAEDNDKDRVIIEDNDKHDKKETALLPKTATSYYNWLLIGSVLIVLAGILLWINRKRKQAE